MKKFIIVLIATALIGSSPLLSANLRNKDSKRYNIKVIGGVTVNTSIGGNTTRLNICSSCKIKVEGVGTIEVNSSDKVILIKDGKLSKS